MAGFKANTYGLKVTIVDFMGPNPSQTWKNAIFPGCAPLSLVEMWPMLHLTGEEFKL